MIARPDPTPAEAAAVMAAVEQFLSDTAPGPSQPPEPTASRWKRAALTEAVARHPDLELPGVAQWLAGLAAEPANRKP